MVADQNTKRPDEIAEVIVEGRVFRDWLTVMVEHRYGGDSHSLFDFTATEKSDLVKGWAQYQFTPGNIVEIRLAGIPAMKGYITHREVAYDKNTHGVRLIGRSFTWDIARSSVETKNGNFDNKPFMAVANALCKPFGIPVVAIGAVDNEPFKRLQVTPGEKVYQCLDRIARHRGIVLGSTWDGKLVAIGPHSGSTGETLQEGYNILRANCSMSDQHIFQKYFGIGQQGGDDQVNGDMAAKQEATVGGSLQRYAPVISSTEHAGTDSDVKKRVAFERQWREGTVIDCEIVVQGWLNSQRDLWRVGTYPLVISPMLPMYEPLGMRWAKFEQSTAKGTTTTLNLVAPWFLNGHVPWHGKGPSIAPEPTEEATNNP